jgi:DNA-binding SARP family transcriptional activator/TolB-like protein
MRSRWERRAEGGGGVEACPNLRPGDHSGIGSDSFADRVPAFLRIPWRFAEGSGLSSGFLVGCPPPYLSSPSREDAPRPGSSTCRGTVAREGFMVRLRLLGGATIEGPGGPLTGRIAQRRQMALLAVLAVRGERPTSRDKLLALLWPDQNAERARHNLADAVYLIRKDLGEDSVLSLGDDLLLSPEHLRSDAWEFQRHLAGGDLEGAIALYAGPFLDGFHFPDSGEFEHWLETERERLFRAHLGALEELALRSERSGETTGAAEWWRRAAAAEPENTRVAASLARALAASGDRAGALRAALLHQKYLRDEFDLDDDPALAALVEELRGPGGSQAGFRPHRPQAPPESVPDPPSSSRPIDPPSQGSPHVVRPGMAPARSGILVGSAVGTVLVLLVAAIYLRENGGPPPSTTSALDPSSVAVLPFRSAGAAAELDYLGQGMAELLGATLQGGMGLTAVDPGAVLTAWREVAPEREAEPSMEAGLEVARARGAGRAILGSVVGTPGGLSLRATLVDAGTGARLAEGAVEGPEGALPELVDRLAAQLLARHAGEAEHRLAHLTSTSLPALRAFLDARAAHRRGDYEVALREYGRTLDLDSTFALAGLGTIQISGWVGGTGPLRARGAAVALANLDRFSERDRAGLQGGADHRDPGGISSTRDNLAAVEEALRRWPDHAHLWYLRGDHLLHQGRSLQLPAWERRARESFERAMELDPNYAEPVHHLAVHLGEMGDTAALRSLVEGQLQRNTAGPVADHLRWRAHHNLGPASPVRPPALEEMDTDATLRWIGIEAQDYAFAFEEGRRAVEIRLGRPGIRDEHFERRLGAFAWALNRGRPAEALSVLETIREVEPDPYAHLRLAVLTALYADGDPGVGEEAARELAAGPTEDAVGELNLCVRAQWRIARGEAGPEGLEEGGLPPVHPAEFAGAWASYRIICSAVVHAQHAAVRSGGPDPEATEHLEGVLRMGRHARNLVDDGHIEFAHLALARLHEAAGNPEAALRALRRRVRYLGWQPYLAASLREEGRLAAAVGDLGGALQAWEHYLGFRWDPEPSLVEEVARIREEVAGIGDALGQDARYPPP